MPPTSKTDRKMTMTTKAKDARLSVPELANVYSVSFQDRIDTKTIHNCLRDSGLIDYSVSPYRVTDPNAALEILKKYYPPHSERPIIYETIAKKTGKSVLVIREVFQNNRLVAFHEGVDYWKGGVFKWDNVYRRSAAYIFSESGEQKLIALLEPEKVSPVTEQTELDLGDKVMISVERVNRLAQILEDATKELNTIMGGLHV
jgi:hypothetical protein